MISKDKTYYQNFMKYFVIFILIISIMFITLSFSFANKYPKPHSKATSSPKKVISYYIMCWKDSNYKKMYATIIDFIKQDYSYKDFKSNCLEHKKMFGLPKTFNILHKIKDQGNKSLWNVSIVFTNKQIGQIKLKNWCEQYSEDNWRISNGPLLFKSNENLFYQ